MAIAGQVLGSIFASISAESWRLAFLMQVLFVCFTVIAIYKHFPDEKQNNQNKKIDFVGLTLLGLSISTLFILSEIFLKNVAITTKLVYIYGYKICMILGLTVITVVMLISIIFDIYYSYITFCTVAMVYNFVLGMYQTSSNTVMYLVIDYEKLDSFNIIKNFGNMISSAIVLTIFTLVYNIYHNYVIYHNWLQIFEEVYFCIVVTSAVVQIIMVVWIALRMDNY